MKTILITVTQVDAQGIYRFDAMPIKDYDAIAESVFIYDDKVSGGEVVVQFSGCEPIEDHAEYVAKLYMQKPFLSIVDWTAYNALVTDETKEQYRRRYERLQK